MKLMMVQRNGNIANVLGLQELIWLKCLWASLVAQMVKNLPETQATTFNPRVGKIPWTRKWLPTPVFLPGESQGSLVGYSPWGHKDSGTMSILPTQINLQI